MAGIRACVKQYDKVLVARNCHKSVYNAIELNFLEPVFIEPEKNEFNIDLDISAEQVEKSLKEYQDIKLVVITSPNYEGVISNIKKISEIAHKYNIPVLVDEAHGAHLNFMKELKEAEAINSGADIVVQSLHKTLPALTQTAIMHIQGNMVSENKVERALDIFETSSPSYILMSSIDECLTIIEEKGIDLFKKYEDNLKEFYTKIDELKKLKILKNHITNNVKYDSGKIVIITEETNINGKQLADILRIQYNIEVEMANVNYIIAMTSICDTNKNFEKLADALIEVDERLEYKNEREQKCNKKNQEYFTNIPERKMSIKETEMLEDFKFTNFRQALGMVSKEYIWIYPPGIPIIAPGEIICKEVIKTLESIMQSHISVKTSCGKFPEIAIIDR